MMPPLDVLRSGLARSFSDRRIAPETWSNLDEMVRARERVQLDHGGAGIIADQRSILASIADFRKTREIGGFRDLKYVCLGIGALDSKGWSVLADEELRSTVARSAEQQAAMHRRLRCFQALLSSYFSFPAHGTIANEDSTMGWRGLRGWLRAERDKIVNLLDFKPPWLEALLRHPELLTNQPCDSFGSELLRGDATGLNDAREGLAIPETSWVVEEAVLAQMKAATDLTDAGFKGVLLDLLGIAMGRSGVPISESLAVRCVALLVSRYARCHDRPEQPTLRDAAVSIIGNPWLRRTNWDAWVRLGGKADDQAREMVFFWLKERLIVDFFELLSEDGINDRRRVAYWLRFVPFIDDMWFALGNSASMRKGGKFGEFRERAKGRLLGLEGTTADNNAFVMRIGAYLAVEFGAGGNAFYLFRWDSISPSVNESLNARPGRVIPGVHIGELKNDGHLAKLRHGDSPVALKSWEQKFDDKLTRLIGKNPDIRPACVPELEVLVADGRVKVNDLRAAGGALWVHEAERSSHLAKKLEAMDFAFRPNRGWFKE